MKTGITLISELKDIFLEIFFSKTDKISKVSSTSVTNAIAYGIAKIGQKALKDISIVESQLYPEYASDEWLDQIAERYGIFERFEQLGSSTYIYIFAEPGTIYYKNISRFINTNGITFILDSNITIPEYGYIYAKAYSEEVGERANVEPLSIRTCVNPPTGHKFCLNEFMAVGGRNRETDEELLYRIENIHNILATKTLDYLVQIALGINQNILKFAHLGTVRGKTRLAAITQNGAILTDAEINELTVGLQDYLSVSDISDAINSRIIIQNVNYTPIDISFKVDYSDSFSIDEIYSSIQRKLVNYLDFRYWDLDQKVLWIELYNLVKKSEGVLSLPYSDFKVNGGQNDITVKSNILPKFRSFLIYDIDGVSLLDVYSESMAPVIYPVYKDENFNVYSPVIFN